MLDAKAKKKKKTGTEVMRRRLSRDFLLSHCIMSPIIVKYQSVFLLDLRFHPPTPIIFRQRTGRSPLNLRPTTCKKFGLSRVQPDRLGSLLVLVLLLDSPRPPPTGKQNKHTIVLSYFRMSSEPREACVPFSPCFLETD